MQDGGSKDLLANPEGVSNPARATSARDHIYKHDHRGEIKIRYTHPWWHWPLDLVLKVLAGIIVGLSLVWLGSQPEVQQVLSDLRPWLEAIWRKGN